MRDPGSEKFPQYLTVGEAAEYLGVSPWTLRNWDKSGKLKPLRHPKNGYRIYRQEDLAAVLRPGGILESSALKFVGGVDWSEVSDGDHVVQFYESESFLVSSVCSFLEGALSSGSSAFVVAAPERRNAIESLLAERGVDLESARGHTAYISLDADEALSRFMDGELPDPTRFTEFVGSAVSQLTKGGRRVRAFGEMVALLWSRGNHSGAIKLEQLWNDLAKTHPFALLCAYPIADCSGPAEAPAFEEVCGCHSRVIPGESYSALSSEAERQRMVAVLQQKALTLEAEIETRREVEKALLLRQKELSDLYQNSSRAEIALRQSEQRFARFMQHLPGLAWIKDINGRYVYGNEAAVKAFGTTPQDLCRSTDDDLFPPETAAQFREHDREAAESGIGVQVIETLEHEDGVLHHSLVSKFPIPGPDGAPALVGGMAIDITDRIRAEELLREADRRKDEFLATLAHELRNPLAPISNALRIMRLESGSGVSLEDTRAIIERQVQQMVRIVDDLLDVSRIRSGRLELRTTRIALKTVLENAVETSSPEIELHGHRLEIELPTSGEVFLNGDLTRLGQVISNLLNNSAKYTSPGGKIRLIAAREGNEAVIRVEDTGIGIAPQVLQNVFDMFRQADSTTEASRGGLGIGLSLVRRLVELHGGTVHAFSAGTGKGSEFVVRLPVSDEGAGESDQPDGKSAGAAAARKILVADDNRDSANTLSMMLRMMGNEVRTAYDGVEAVEAASVFLPDIIFMDIGMPKLDGHGATRKIREAGWGSRIFIVALTGWGQAADIERSIEAGCSAHLVKPIDIDELEKLLAGELTPGAQ